YLTTAVPAAADGNDDELLLRAICLDARSGATIWEREVFSQPTNDATSIHPKNSYASPTPLIYDSTLYVHFGPNGTAALDLEGNTIWKKSEIHYDSRHAGA